MKKLPIALAVASSLTLSNAFADDRDNDQRENNYNTYHVTITNTTTNHIITPPTVIAHNTRFKLFEIAQPASEELATMAESGNNGPLIESLDDNEYVYTTASSLDQSPPVILPGSSIVIEIRAPKKTYFTVASMLATTNDAFASVTFKGPKKNHSSNGMAITYDAGSEDNNELCIDIPGPPCGGTNASIDGDGEGFITVHNGIHGIGDLIPSDLDWRGPTASVKIHNAGK